MTTAEGRGSARRPSRAFVVDLVVVLVLVLGALVQNPGRTAFDTKLDLVVDPVGFMSRALHAWDPIGGFGQVQNQAYGYLWPMGPFFGVMHGIGLPPWVAQALWMGLLMGIGYTGVRVLSSRIGIPWIGAVAAGLTYVANAHLLTVLGPISAEALPVVLAPWTLVPLARARQTPRRAAFWSALAVFFMGAANAALTLAVLPLPFLWILTRPAGRARLLSWWCAFVVLLSMWWIVPLLVQGRVAPPFLDYIETSAVTTGFVSPLGALRGVTHWVAFIVQDGAAWWPAGHAWATSSTLLVVTCIVAALGLAGLCMRRMPQRQVWIWSLLLGFVVLTIGANGHAGSPVQDQWRHLLDGPLVPFRNIHKFDTLVRLPLCLGFGLTVASAWSLASRTASEPLLRRVTAAVTVAVACAALVVGAGPVLSPGLRPGPTWQALPSWWGETAAYLSSVSAGRRALLVPGSNFAEYTWGRTVDEPLQPLARAPWAQDNELPLGAVGTARLLDSVNGVLESGRPSVALAALLRRSGIGFLVVRNDLDTAATGAPSPALVHAALDGSPGVRRVAAFGPTLGGVSALPPTTINFAFDPAYPAVEIYEVDGDVPVVAAAGESGLVAVAGGSESLLPLLAAGSLDDAQPTVLAVDGGERVAPQQLVTDGLRRRERGPGRVQGSLSTTMTREESGQLGRGSLDLLPPGADRYLTVAQFDGIEDVTASSSGAYASSLTPTDPAQAPSSAVDGDPLTWWQSASFGGPVGQWLEIELPSTRSVVDPHVTFVDTPAVGPTVTEVTVTTDGGSVVQKVNPGGGRQTLLLPAGETRRLRVTVTGVLGDERTGYVGIRELDVTGAPVTRPLLVAGAVEASPETDGVVFDVDSVPRGPCVVVGVETRCNPTIIRGSEEPRGIDRLLDVATPWDSRWTARVAAASGAGVAGLFDPVGPGIRAGATSWLGQDVRVRPSSAVDGDPGTAWVASLGDPDPALTLTLPVERAIGNVTLVNGEQPAVSRPTAVEVTTDSGVVFSGPLGRDGSFRLPEVRTRSLTIRITGWTALTSVQPDTRFRLEAPVGISEVLISGAEDLVYSPDLSAATGAVCGLGPRLVVDGQPSRTAVVGTLSDILRGRDLTVTPCGSSTLQLDPGRHRIRLEATDDFLPTSLALTHAPPSTAPSREVRVTRWDGANRAVAVAAGGAAVLRVAESANIGWRATYGGQRLQPLVVDGWQQAWLLPAGAAGVVTVTYTPDAWHRGGLAAGAVCILVAALLGLWPRRRERPNALRESILQPRTALAAAVGAGWLVAGWPGLAVACGVLLCARLLRGLGQPLTSLVPVVLTGAAVVAVLAGPGGPSGRSSLAGVSLAILSAVLWPAAAVAFPARQPSGTVSASRPPPHSSRRPA